MTLSLSDSTSFIGRLRSESGDLYTAVEALVSSWLKPVIQRLEDIDNDRDRTLRSKHLNDAVWKTIELRDYEILLIDSPLVQRMRGVRQLGLAQLVFPGGNHDRFEHICGVVEAADRLFNALKDNVDRRSQDNGNGQANLPKLDDRARQLVRMAALLHDIGHGPFSHAIEPVVEHRYSQDVKKFNNLVMSEFYLDSRLAVAEVISILIIVSETFGKVLAHQRLKNPFQSPAEYQLRIAVLVMGARWQQQDAYLSAIISGQVDADKLDYMARDAHHTGMPISFDTERLIRKLEVVACTPDNLPSTKRHKGNVDFANECPNKRYFDVAVVASGVGALEQMLIGRAFLYDRLYHHHKVRAADVMAQRLIRFAEEERGEPFNISDLYLTAADDTMIRLLGGELQRNNFKSGGEKAGQLSKAITERNLYHRAFAFRASFHCGLAQNLDEKARQDALADLWSPISTELSSLQYRVELEEAIFERAKDLCEHIADQAIKEMGATICRHHVIVDLADNRVRPVIINVHTEEGVLEEPNLFFDPARWSLVYDLQKRTGYVFCPRQFTPLIGLAAAIVFFERWGYAGSRQAARFVKMGKTIKPQWLADLRSARIIDDAAASVLEHRDVVRSFIRADDLKVPREWRNEAPELTTRIADDLRLLLPLGLSTEDKQALAVAFDALTSFLLVVFSGDLIKAEYSNEKEFQWALRNHLVSRGVSFSEGEKLAGGETDLVIADRVLVENKIDRAGEDPFEVKPDAPYQANRYARALCTRIIFTVVAYKPKSEADLLPQTQCIRVKKIAGLKFNAIEIRLVVPFGLSDPSRAKAKQSVG